MGRGIGGEMVCPVCRARMMKVRRAREELTPDRIRCLSCAFTILYRGLAPPRSRAA